MRILQIGLGRWGQNHLRTWRKLAAEGGASAPELLVCDTRPELLNGLAEKTSLDWRELLPEADALDVVTPAPAHTEMVRAALEAGKHVLVEKPLTPRAAEGFALARLARERGCIVQVGHVFRFAPEARAVADAVRAGRVGRVRCAMSRFAGFKRPRTDGGLAISDGVHFVDLLSWLLGRQPAAVTAVMRDFLGRGMDDLALLALDYGDALGHVEASCFPPEQRRDLVVIGSEGAIVCDFLAKGEKVRLFANVHRAAGDGAFEAAAGEVTPLVAAGEEPLAAELRAFHEACRAGRPCAEAADAFAGAAATAVIEAAERSAAEGRRVALVLPC